MKSERVAFLFHGGVQATLPRGWRVVGPNLLGRRVQMERRVRINSHLRRPALFEKSWKHGLIVARIAGFALMLLGAAVIVHPALLASISL
jgi:hypothetical protein